MLRIPSYVKPFDDDHVRAAMHLSIDTAALSKAFYGGVAKPLSVMTPEGTPSYVSDFKFPVRQGRRPSTNSRPPATAPANPVALDIAQHQRHLPERLRHGACHRPDVEGRRHQRHHRRDHARQAGGSRTERQADRGAALQLGQYGTGDPENYAGRIFDPRLRFATWKDMSLAPRIDALMTEVDDDQAHGRLQGAQCGVVGEVLGDSRCCRASPPSPMRRRWQPLLFGNGYVLPVDYKLQVTRVHRRRAMTACSSPSTPRHVPTRPSPSCCAACWRPSRP